MRLLKISPVISAIMITGLVALPVISFADGDHKTQLYAQHKKNDLEKIGEGVRRAFTLPKNSQSARRQKSKNEWRNIATAAGALAVIGILKGDNRLTFVGGAGALYSLYRYEQDRKSQSKADRLRATYFSKSYFYRDGQRYNRKTVVKNGKKYYQFVKAR
ncbi:MAG: hypothetical protein ABL949_07095 [Fimbriimonadaceae bacterium]